jgi:hypothetical protein
MSRASGVPALEQVPTGHAIFFLPYLGELIPMQRRSEHPPGPLPSILLAYAPDETTRIARLTVTIGIREIHFILISSVGLRAIILSQNDELRGAMFEILCFLREAALAAIRTPNFGPHPPKPKIYNFYREVLWPTPGR